MLNASFPISIIFCIVHVVRRVRCAIGPFTTLRVFFSPAEDLWMG
jgi:hypothetical protein